MNYLFYLEPYAFLLRSNDKTVVYNTLNATYLICPDYPIVQLIIEQWQNPTNGYSVLLDKEMMENEVVRHFYSIIPILLTWRSSFENGVSRNISTILRASPGPMTLAPIASIFASLCSLVA